MKIKLYYSILLYFIILIFSISCHSYNPKKRQPGILYDVDRILTNNTNLTGKYELKDCIIYFNREHYDSLILEEYRNCEEAILNGYPCYSSLEENEVLKKLYTLSIDSTDTLDISNLEIKKWYDFHYELAPDQFINYLLLLDQPYRVFNKKINRFEDTIVFWDRDKHQTILLFKNGDKIYRKRSSKVRVKF